MSEWQPIETAPKDVSVILLYRTLPGSLSWGICYWNGKRWAIYDAPDKSFYGASHWMPLPEAPLTE